MKWDLDKQADEPTEMVIDGEISLDLGEGAPEMANIEGLLGIKDLASRVLIKGKLKASGQAVCSRCLNDFLLQWTVPVEMVILRSHDHEEEEGSVIVLAQRRGVADLQPGLRECTLLAYPQSAVCRADCRGICVTCGVDLNETTCDCRPEVTDPRWDALP